LRSLAGKVSTANRKFVEQQSFDGAPNKKKMYTFPTPSKAIFSSDFKDLNYEKRGKNETTLPYLLILESTFVEQKS
jgi:hypothetical protein